MESQKKQPAHSQRPASRSWQSSAATLADASFDGFSRKADTRGCVLLMCLTGCSGERAAPLRMKTGRSALRRFVATLCLTCSGSRWRFWICWPSVWSRKATIFKLREKALSRACGQVFVAGRGEKTEHDRFTLYIDREQIQRE